MKTSRLQKAGLGIVLGLLCIASPLLADFSGNWGCYAESSTFHDNSPAGWSDLYEQWASGGGYDVMMQKGGIDTWEQISGQEASNRWDYYSWMNSDWDPV